jgi:signal transduction histidine kinase
VDPLLVARVDEGDFSEIAGNLIENSARFASSRVRIEAGDIEDDFVLTIADDGPGIPAAQREDVLRRGIRLDGGQGSGLGLAIVSDIVKAYRGTLELADAGPGLRVTVRIPKPSSS